MKNFRYDLSGSWFKGNTHIHSTASDGGKSFAELADMYAGQGYDFLFRTDHWVTSDVAADPAAYPLLWLDGTELDGKDGCGNGFHIVCLGRLQGLDKAAGFFAGIETARRQGALLILAHPHWCDNNLDDCARLGLHGVEIYNHVCHWLNGKGNGLAYWGAAMNHNPEVLGFAADDTHARAEHPGWNGGWIMVNAADKTPAALLAAIRRGNFYSTCGPEIRALRLEERKLSIETSPVKFARLVGPGWRGRRAGDFSGRLLTSAEFQIDPEWRYAYVEIEDAEGRRAWTNNLFTEQAPAQP